MQIKLWLVSVAACMLTGCSCYRWQGGLNHNSIFQNRPESKFVIDHISFEFAPETMNGMYVFRLCGEINDIGKQAFIANIMKALPEVYVDEAGAEHLDVVIKVTKGKHNSKRGRNFISLGVIWPMEFSSEWTYEVTVVRNGVRGKPIGFSWRYDEWRGWPWTLAVHFGYPDRDERFTESVTSRSVEYFELISEAKAKVLAKAIYKAAINKK